MASLVADEQHLIEVIDRVAKRTFQMDFTWDWPGGVAFFGVSEAYEATGNQTYLALLKEWVDERIEEGLPKLTVNGVSVGHTLLSLYQATNEETYLNIAIDMAEYLKHDAPRFADGIFEHTVSEGFEFPQQAWVDTMMMAGYFLLRMGVLLEHEDYMEDGLKQYHGHEELLQDNKTNLYYHGWDHIAQSHMSAVFWARGNAWAALTMAKALDFVQVQHPSYMLIDGSLRDQLSALVRLQDESGLWHTVLHNNESYLETSGSAGIATALLYRGTLYDKFVQRAITGILNRINEDGVVTGVSAGTAVMDDEKGYMNVPTKRIQGWGQGLTLSFLATLLKRISSQSSTCLL